MVYTEREQLTIFDLKGIEDCVPLEELNEIMRKSPSNMIYCERNGKIEGIISTGDIWRAYRENKDLIPVNKNFTYIFYGQYQKAKKILKEGKNINAIPVITTEHVLVGNYSRWDDLLVVGYLIDIDHGRSAEKWKKYQSIKLVRPGEKFVGRQKAFRKFQEYLEQHNIETQCIEHSEVFQYLGKKNIILFVDEDEIRACRTGLKVIYGVDSERCNNLITYKRMFESGACFDDEECALYLKRLQDKGIRMIGLVFRENKYYKRMLEEIEKRFAAVGEVPSNKLPEPMYKDFFDDSYSEEYAHSIMNMPIEFKNNDGVFSLKDHKSQYYNVLKGERHTAGQPKQYENSIYFFGACYIYGHYVEDKNTIESLLQKHICTAGRNIRVVNCGSLDTVAKYGYLARIASTQLKTGDVLVVDRPPENIEGVCYLDLNQVLEKKGVDVKWMVDKSLHCNHKINKLYADAIYEILEPVLRKETNEQGMCMQKKEEYIDFLYLNRYFAEFNPSEHGKIGSIVMNCNPFTMGHRFLIEQALKAVDFLIVFVVEEDKSAFSFSERMAMVKEGVADLNDVMVVPSGPFILSQMTFPEYFIKEKSKSIIENTENDIAFFAKEIAPRLGIKCRIFGEEPLDEITKQYNSAMEKLLPQYGIEAMVIPRKTVGGDVISASRVRKCLDEGNVREVNELLPETTKRMLGLTM